MTVPHYSEPKMSLTRLLFRLLAGRDLDGYRRTNATFTRRASRDLTPHGRASRWAWQPGWRRAAVRLAVLAVSASSGYGYWRDRALTVDSALAACACIVALAAWRAYVNGRRFNHRRKVVYPLWHILVGITGFPLEEDYYRATPRIGKGMANPDIREKPERFLEIPQDFKTNENAIVKFTMPYTYEANAKERTRITQLMASHLGGDWSATWNVDTMPRYVAMCHMPRPPSSVTLAEFVPHIDAAGDSVLVLGMGASKKVIGIDLDSESPHVLLSMSTGGGKSDTTALIVAQLVRKGVQRIDIIDPKKVSHNWARGLPGVFIHRHIAAQMEAVHNTRLRMDSRYDAIETNDDAEFPRHVLIIEEQNSFMDELKLAWDDMRREMSSNERGSAPKVNPAITDLRYILNKGRQCRINVISIFQRASAAATGGGDARENYGAKVLCRISPQTWKMLVGIGTMPRMSRQPGRAVVVIGDDVREVQRAHANFTLPNGKINRAGVKVLREFALNGAADTTQPGNAAAPVTEPAAAETEYVTLREACETKVVPMRYAALQKARKRDPEFPAGTVRGSAVAYVPADLARWHANRPRAGRVRQAA